MAKRIPIAASVMGRGLCGRGSQIGCKGWRHAALLACGLERAGERGCGTHRRNVSRVSTGARGLWTVFCGAFDALAATGRGG